MHRMRTGIALFLFVVSFGLVIREGASAHPTPLGTWIFVGVLTFSSGILLCIYVYKDEVASERKPKLRKHEPNGFIHAAAVVIGLAQIVSIISRLLAGWDSLGAGVKLFFVALGLILVVMVVILIGHSVSRLVKKSRHSIQLDKATAPNHSTTLALIGIGSFLVFSFAMKEVQKAHSALTKLQTPDLFSSRSTVDLQTLLHSQSYSSDRMFWAFVGFVAIGITLACVILKRRE